jgi:hypothetical protein
MEWSRGTTVALVNLMEDALVYLQSAGVAA